MDDPPSRAKRKSTANSSMEGRSGASGSVSSLSTAASASSASASASASASVSATTTTSAAHPKRARSRGVIRTSSTSASARTSASTSTDRPSKKNSQGGFDDVVVIRTREERMKELVGKGQELLAKKKPREAYDVFKKALLCCSCYDEVRMQFRKAGASLSAFDPASNCVCKDFVAAAQKRRTTAYQPAPLRHDGDAKKAFLMSQLDPDAVYRLALSDCTCGAGRSRSSGHCTNVQHVAALDRLIATAARLQDADRALRLAQSLVEFAPAQPEGYLHLAKLVAAADPSADGQFVARCIYRHGAYNVKRYGDGTKEPMVQLLSNFSRKMVKVDIVMNLPIELLEMVFEKLDLHDVICCLRVSKSWNAIIRSLGPHMNSITLGDKGKPSMSQLLRFRQRLPHLQVERLTISQPFQRDKNFDDLAAETAAYISTAISLFRDPLEINLLVHSSVSAQAPRRMFSPPISVAPSLRRCRRLAILSNNTTDAFGSTRPGSDQTIHLGILHYLDNTLESLTIQLRYEHIDCVLARLPHLRTLSVGQFNWSYTPRKSFLPTLLLQAPNLETLVLKDMSCSQEVTDITSPNPRFYDVLKNLKTLILEGGSSCDRSFQFPNLPPGIRRIDIGADIDVAVINALFRHNVSSGSETETETETETEEEPVSYDRLEALRINARARPDDFGPRLNLDKIKPFLSSPSLTSLELNWFDITAPILTREMYSEINPSQIRTLGVLDMEWVGGTLVRPVDAAEDGLSYRQTVPSIIANHAFWPYLRQFTNLETLTLDMHTNIDLHVAVLAHLFKLGVGSHNITPDGTVAFPHLKRIYVGPANSLSLIQQYLRMNFSIPDAMVDMLEQGIRPSRIEPV